MTEHASITHNVGVNTPHNAEIVKITELTDSTKLFELKFVDKQLNDEFKYNPGQFVLVSVFGIGEIPIGLSSSPTSKGSFELAIRKVGNVTNKIHSMKEGDIVGIKGPLGRGFPVEEHKGKDILYIAGGIGNFPIRSAFRYAYAKRENYGRLMYLYGDRCPDDVLFQEENEEYEKRDDIEFYQTVDRDDDKCWAGNIGVVTTLIPKISENLDIDNTIAMICGPPIMYRFVIMDLEKLGIKPDNIYLSLERKMKCGVGKCCHCGMGDKFVCIDGPVFSLDEIRGSLEAL